MRLVYVDCDCEEGRTLGYAHPSTVWLWFPDDEAKAVEMFLEHKRRYWRQLYPMPEDGGLGRRYTSIHGPGGHLHEVHP